MTANKKFSIWLLICATVVIMVAVVYGCQPAMLVGHSFTSKREMSLKLAAEYKRNGLVDMSPDGRLMLFYQTSTPIRTYTVPLDGSGIKANQPEVYDDVFRVVELASGRETSRIGIRTFSLNARFVPGTQQIFYSEKKADKPGALYKLGNFITGQTRVCLDAPEGGFYPVVFLDKQRALGAVTQQVEQYTGELLGELKLPDCTRKIISPVNPTDPRDRTWGKLVLSPDKRFLAYSLYGGHQTIIWDIANREVAERLNVAPLFTGNDVITYTSDGKLLIINANTRALGGEDNKSYLMFYDTKTYRLVRRQEVPGASAIAVSPDGRLLAVGYTKEEKKAFSITEQAQVVLYDLATSEEVARASHPPVKQQRSDPFIAKVTRLAFTPDGKNLLSSTYDTLMWQLGD